MTKTNIIIDSHVHIYPRYAWRQAVQRLLDNLTHAAAPLKGPDDAIILGLLAESRTCHFFRAVSGHSIPADHGDIQLHAGPDPDSLTIKHQGRIRGYLIAGRQVITAERLEILALGVNATFEDGLRAGDTLQAIQAAGAIPVLSWSPGKWFGKRGALVRNLIEHSATNRFLIGDTALRPTLWPLPRLMRLAQQRGFTRIGGSDALPLAGEEHWIGTYGSAITAGFDPARPAFCLRQYLTAPPAPFIPVGGRNGTASFLSRWIRNQTRNLG